MFVSYKNNFLSYNNKLLNYKLVEDTSFQPFQALINPDFTEMETNVKPLGWETNTQFVPYCGASCGSNDINPSANTGNLVFGRSATAVVFQNYIIDNINVITQFDLEYTFSRNNRTSSQYVLIRFLDTDNNIIIDKRDPTTGLRSSPSVITTDNLILNRNEINNFNNIHSVRVEVYGVQSPYTWSGHYGTIFYNVSLNIS